MSLVIPSDSSAQPRRTGTSEGASNEIGSGQGRDPGCVARLGLHNGVCVCRDLYGVWAARKLDRKAAVSSAAVVSPGPLHSWIMERGSKGRCGVMLCLVLEGECTSSFHRLLLVRSSVSARRVNQSVSFLFCVFFLFATHHSITSLASRVGRVSVASIGRGKGWEQGRK